jgi:hypothetical protein
MKEYFQDNKESIMAKHREYNEKNKEKVKEYMNTYIKHKYKTDTNFKVKNILSSRLRSCLRKQSSTIDFLGCSMQHFLEWIEYQFDEHMTWENCGSYWHFDHVMPCASYDLSIREETVECFNWKNIRPFEAKKNISKGSKICHEIIDKHKQIVKQFITRRTKEQ